MVEEIIVKLVGIRELGVNLKRGTYVRTSWATKSGSGTGEDDEMEHIWSITILNTNTFILIIMITTNLGFSIPLSDLFLSSFCV